MKPYSAIFIIYNPNSTGPSEKMSQELQAELMRQIPDFPVELRPTEHAGHAEELAQQLALEYRNPLIVSASGDGGYNEVINGVLKARAQGSQAVCAVLPAGNANDHSNAVSDRPLVEAIVEGQMTEIDVLLAEFSEPENADVRQETANSEVEKLRATMTEADGPDPHSKRRYAHSYIGLGLTPVVAVELNKHSLNPLKEAWIVSKAFYKLRPLTIRVGPKDGPVIKVDSLICANIDKMSKILTVDKEGELESGTFAVVMFPHAHKLKLIARLVHAATFGLDPPKRTSQFEFTVLKPAPIQLDGEVTTLAADTTVRVTCLHKGLRTIA